MKSQVLWVLDSEIESQAFERLCADLLYRNGFKDIVPVEPQDGGRDAEEHVGLIRFGGRFSYVG